ncbi:MAG: nudF [Lacunisphaera sp.]|nr:nudF [Lacunisphaera sp.]
MPDHPPEPQRWKKLGARTVAHTRIFDVQSVDYHHPHRAKKQDFVVIAAPDWVNVVALTPEHHLVLVRQFRYGIDEFSVEIPGGVMDPGEDAVGAGLRELQEETGYVGTGGRLLGSIHPNPAMQNNRCHLVLVENARRTAELGWDPDEEIETTTRPVDDVYALAYSGGITNAMVLDGLLLFAPVWAELRKK